jgi:hypothetical protein
MRNALTPQDCLYRFGTRARTSCRRGRSPAATTRGRCSRTARSSARSATTPNWVAALERTLRHLDRYGPAATIRGYLTTELPEAA